jgi:Ca-activated chloride channel family protein
MPGSEIDKEMKKVDKKGIGINSLSAGIFLVIAISILLLLSLSLSLLVSVASAEGTYFELDKQISPENITFGPAEDLTVKISISVPEKISIDVIFAIDSSGSMRYSDPEGTRIECVKNFIDEMDISSDRAGLVSCGTTT